MKKLRFGDLIRIDRREYPGNFFDCPSDVPACGIVDAVTEAGVSIITYRGRNAGYGYAWLSPERCTKFGRLTGRRLQRFLRRHNLKLCFYED